MASVRVIKKDIDYLIEEVLADSYFAIYFHPDKKDYIVKIMEDAVELRNNLFNRVNNPVEKNNPRLVRKHYMQIRMELIETIDLLFDRLSKVACADKKESTAKSAE